MKRLFVLAVLFATQAHASEDKKKMGVPQEVLNVIRLDCTKTWTTNFQMRLICEEGQIEAYMKLKERGAISVGEKL